MSITLFSPLAAGVVFKLPEEKTKRGDEDKVAKIK